MSHYHKIEIAAKYADPLYLTSRTKKWMKILLIMLIPSFIGGLISKLQILDIGESIVLYFWLIIIEFSILIAMLMKYDDINAETSFREQQSEKIVKVLSRYLYNEIILYENLNDDDYKSHCYSILYQFYNYVVKQENIEKSYIKTKQYQQADLIRQEITTVFYQIKQQLNSLISLSRQNNLYIIIN